jgi:hypothetical protein
MSKPFTEVPLPKEKPLCTDFATATAAGLRPEMPSKAHFGETPSHAPRGAIGSITGENGSGGDISAHRDLRSVPGAADLIEIEGCGKVPLSVDLRFQIGDLLLRSGNGVNICRQLEDSVIEGGPQPRSPPNRAAAWPHQLSLRSCPRVR